MARVYISLGSNIDAPRHLRAAIAALRERYGELTLSPVYESEAVGFEGDNFLNLVVGLDTDQEVREVNRCLHAIEDAHGRQRNGPRFSPRTLDLDLLLYDDLILHEDKLQLPRDEITRNAFVLRPLADIAPDLRHPLTGRTMAELWQAFDQASQRLWPIPFEW